MTSHARLFSRPCRRPRFAAAAVTAVALSASLLGGAGDPAHAAEALVPGTTSWSLAYERGERFCLAHAFFPRSGVAMGFVSDGEHLGVGLVNGDWRLRERLEYGLAFRFDDAVEYDALFTATDATAMASELDREAEEAFRRAARVEIVDMDGRRIGHFSLAGSARAIDYVRTCGQLADLQSHREVRD